MRIGIMLRHLEQHPGGVKIYTHELLDAMIRIGTGHEFVLFLRKQVDPALFGGLPNVSQVVVHCPTRLLWDQVALPRAVQQQRVDVLFNPKFSIPLGVDCKTVWVCHGLDWYVMPWASRPLDRLSHRYLVPRYARKADAIIAVSETVRDHALQYLQVPADKVHVVYSGTHARFRQPVDAAARQSLRARYRLPERFILFVGAFYPPKNIARLVQAYAECGPARGYHLVVAGGTDRFLAANDVALPERLGLQEWVHMIGWLEPHDLPPLYSMATALLMPSLYEACPLPIIEAMACGCPIITADRYGTRELAGDAAVLVDPENVQSIAEGVVRVIEDPGLRATLSARGRQRAAAMTWERAGRQTLDVLEKVGSPHS